MRSAAAPLDLEAGRGPGRGVDPQSDQVQIRLETNSHWSLVQRTTTGQEESKRSRPVAVPAHDNSCTMTSSTRGEFHSIKVGDTLFTVLKRYTDLASIGSGAQGVVW